MKKIITLAVASVLMCGTLQAQESRYMGGEVEMTTLPNGGVLNKNAPESLAKTWTHESKVVQLAEGIWSLEGFAHVNCAVIEGENSLIIYDTGNDIEDGKKFLNEIKKISNKPVKTIIYSHAHYVWGSSPLLEGQMVYNVIGHPNLNKNIKESGGMGASIPELSPLLTGRAYEQFDIYTPSEGEDAPLASSPIGKGEKGFAPVTKPVEDGEIVTIDGVKMQFFTEFSSDTDDCLLVYFPEKELVLNNLYWPVYSNQYTLRGSLYRDPIPWMNGLKKIRDLNPKYMINTHTTAISGKEKVMEAVTNYHDGLAYLYDQTLRQILLGASPNELSHIVQLPKHLAEWPNNQLTYGEMSQYPKNIYNYALGWYDGNATNINKVEPSIEARKMVLGFGGKNKMMEQVEIALDNKEYAWATQLTDYLYKVYPNDQKVRQQKADALRKMGQVTESSISRSWYLSQARALENKVMIPHIILPEVAQIMDSEPGTFVNMMRVRINPEKSIDTNKLIVFEFTDVENRPQFGLHIRNGIAEFVENPSTYYKEKDVVIKVPRELFANYYAGKINVEKLLFNSNKVSMNINQTEVQWLLEQFDWFDAKAPILKYNKGVSK
ncbi:alkyl sulfatase dimerization domain-containing protein [Flammeovirga sp. EKP202]|uniref:alkyl sulfatase dimerization domain-containing protein n=1 Tax=Flammeovirga sp. EKP202 TaxID=2770592 RepID=UPI00165F3E73|nr:alkyl sulfatase dimerization domain-containing protein [Flammeovirga sp. EKP202]MBD0399952.1 MBL fold metallo-hydrolase [Flammeovirga sp. EKP202]